MRRTSILSVLGLAVCSVSCPASEPDALETVPYRAKTDGYFAFRIPSLVVSTKGTLLAFCEGRKTSLSDDGDNDLVLRRSVDGGRIWGPLQLVHEEGGDAVVTIGNPCAVVDRDTGTIWLTLNRKNGRVLVTSSDDDGATWSPVRDVTNSTSDPGWGWYAMGPGCGIQLRHGKHRGRLVVPANHRETPDRSGPSASHVVYSDDHGRTWKLGGTVGPHTNECQVAELHDGTLLINCRNHWGRSGNDPAKKGRRITALSRDGGASWSEPTLDDELPEPTCQAGLVARAKPAADGRTRLVFTNPNSKSRERMTVRFSDDGGATWPTSRLIFAGSAAYSSPAELPDGRIGLLYERNDYAEIAFTVIDVRP